jgi:hypothetical protein
MPTYGFHPEALLEYAEAAQYYVREAPPGVAEAFITAVESAVEGILAAPTQWRIVEDRAFVGMSSAVFRSFSTIIGKQNKGALASTPSCIAAENPATGDTESPNLAHALDAARGRCLHFRDHWRRASDAHR